MKTIKITSVLSLALIFVAATSLFAGKATKTSNLPSDRVKVITYIVKVNENHNLLSSAHQYLIVMTDETGRQIAPPQVFRNGIWSYTFTEVGNVIGTRVAKMLPALSVPGSAAVSSSSRTGSFFGGQIYKFNLLPRPEPIEAGNAKD